jgi:hypothetical protein
MRTIEDAKAWGKAHEAECLATYAECKEIPDFLRSPRLEAIWISGCWLKDAIASAGATDAQQGEIGFCHGQRCMYADPWESAVAYANEFERQKTVADRPGRELAERLIRENTGHDCGKDGGKEGIPQETR